MKEQNGKKRNRENQANYVKKQIEQKRNRGNKIVNKQKEKKHT